MYAWREDGSCDRQNQGRYDYCLLWDTNPQSVNTGLGFVEVFGEQAICQRMRAENTRVIEVRWIWKPVSFTGAGKDLLNQTPTVKS